MRAVGDFSLTSETFAPVWPSASGVMIDWISVEVPDPFGEVITGGEVLKVKADGEVEWATRCRREFEGSWSSKMQVRNLMADRRVAPGVDPVRSGLELSGNPAKFLQGHNLFGTDDLAGLTGAVVAKVARALYPEGRPVCLDVENGELTRIDITGSWLLDRADDVLPFLKAMEERVWCPFRGRGVSPQDGPGTLYYGYSKKGKRAKDWQLKLYSKGRDIVAHPLPEPALAVPGLLHDVSRTVRVELTLRSAELKRLGLKRVGDWTPETVERIWSDYVNRLDFSEATMNLDVIDMSQWPLNSREILAVSCWKSGNDVRAAMPRSSFYKIRASIRRKTGVDIACHVPKSNVVPLRRVIEAKPALRPHWADHLTEALRVA